MDSNALFHKQFRRIIVAGGLLSLCVGCASLPDATTSTYPAADCRIAPATATSLAGGQRPSANRLDQIKAINDFARLESATRGISPAMQVRFDEILRECGR